MLQMLLEDRFHLRVLRVTKEIPVYALVVGKNGPKFPKPDSVIQRGMMTGSARITAQKLSMEQFTKRLEGVLGRNVVDRTTLKGDFAIELMWTPEPDQPLVPGAVPAESSGV